MALSLRPFKKIWEFITPQNEEAIRRSQASQQYALDKLSTAKNLSGPLADPQYRQQYIQQNQPDRFNLGRAVKKSFIEPFTDPSKRIDVGKFRGSGLVEEFLGSPHKVGGGAVKIKRGQVKQGLGDIVTGAIEGPLGLIPIGKTAQAGLKGGRLLPRVLASAKTGAKEAGTYGTLYGGGRAAAEGAPAGDIFKSALIGGVTGTVGGGVLGGGLPLAGAGIRQAGRGATQLNRQLGQEGFARVSKPKVTPKSQTPSIAQKSAATPVTKPTVTAKQPSAYAPVKGAEAEATVVKALPKTIKQKLTNNMPLTNEDIIKINVVRERINRKFGITPEQQALGLGVETPMEHFKTFQGAATRTTKAGNIKTVTRGQVALSKEAAERFAGQAAEKPSVISRVIASFPGQSAKKFRGLAANLNTMGRKNPRLAKDLDELVFRPLVESQAAAARIKSQWLGNLLDSKKVTNLDKTDRKVLGGVLNGQAKPDVARNPGAITKAATDMRKVYNEAISELNRQELASGVPLTPRRKDYFPHIMEQLGEEKFLAAAKQADPDFVRRLGSAFKFSKARTGNLQNILDDPYEVMDIYLEAAQRRIGSLSPSRNINMIIDSLDEVKLLDRRGLSEMKGWLRSINDDLTGAKAGSNPIERAQGRLAAGTVLANPSSIANNFIQPTWLAGIHPVHSTKGLYKSFFAGVRALKDRNLDNFLKVGGIESSYLRNAADMVDLRRLKDKSILRRLGDKGAQAFYVSDMASKKQVIETLFAKHSATGVNAKRALQLAEREAEGILPSRTPGTLATAFRESTVGRMANLFQTEVMAQFESIPEAVRRKGAINVGGIPRGMANLVGISLAGHAFNKGFGVVFPGRAPAPDPILWAQKALEEDTITEGEQQEDSLVTNTLQFLKNGLGQTPIVGGYFSEFGARTPFPAAEIGSDVISSVKNVMDKDFSGESLVKAGRNISPFLGRGAKPVYRGIEGTVSFAKGGEDKGFEVKKTTGNLIRSILGGAYNSPEAAEMFKNSDNRKKVINSFDEQTRNKYQGIINKTTTKDGQLVREKSIVDQAKQFQDLQSDPDLVKMFTAVSQFDKAQGKPIDPVFDPDFYKNNGLEINKDQMKVFNYLVEQNRNNDVITKAMKEINPWLSKLDNERSKFFDRVTGTGRKLPEITYGPQTPKPEIDNLTREKVNQFFSIEDFVAKQNYLTGNPEVAEYLDQTASYDRAKRIYLGQPIPDEYPEMNPKVKTLNDQFHALPKGNGPKGGSPDRRAFLQQHPELVAQWVAQNIWTLQQEGAKSLYEGIDFSQKALEKVNRLSTNLVQLPDGTWVFNPSGSDSSGGFGRFGKRKPTAGSPYKYAVSLSAAGQPVRPKVSIKKAAKPKVARKTIAQPQISLTKSRV